MTVKDHNGCVLVAHSGRQHSHQLALALNAAGMLAEYWSGVPAVRPGPWMPRRLWDRLVPYNPLDLPSHRVRTLPILPALARTVGRTTTPARAAVVRRIGEQAFDRWAARRLRALPGALPGVRAVVAYENTASHTFREARRRGIVTILDAASVHHTEQDRVHGYEESADLHQRITGNKDVEIALADHILCVSEVARESYLAAGVAPHKLTVVPLGANTEAFTPAEEMRGRGGHVFGFVGGLDRRKGGDVLLEAFACVRSVSPDVQLVVVGRAAGAFASALRQPGITLMGQHPQTAVARILQGIDTLVLPSRHESFGMVVIEALACGVPVIVSDRVGAKDVVEEGVNGWIVPVNDAAALASAMALAVSARHERPEMRQAARHTAEQHTWSMYHGRVVRQISEWLRT